MQLKWESHVAKIDKYQGSISWVYRVFFAIVRKRNKWTSKLDYVLAPLMQNVEIKMIQLFATPIYIFILYF